MRWLKRAWQGEERLWKVFWVYGVAVSCIGFFTALAVEIGTAMSTGVVGTPSESTCFFVYDAWLAVSSCYWVWIIVSLWRCAFNVKQRLLGDGARILAACIVPATTYNLLWERIK
jgi:hypothetical protein